MVITQEIHEQYCIYNSDCMEVLPTLPESRIHLSIYSPPFAGLYHYSSSERDLSNCRDYQEFFDHYEFVIKELFRVTMPGRMSAVHCMDVPTGNTGYDALSDFPGDIIRLHVRCRDEKCTASEFKRARGRCGHGWFDYVARYHVWKEPLTVRNRTMIKALAHKTIVEDSSRCTVASADYLLVFRRKGKNPEPIAHPNGLLEYAGMREIPKELLRYKGWQGPQIENRYSHWIWRQYASAFWDDVRLDNVLPYRPARDEQDEKHVHPLQLDVIERCLHLWSETVITPFMGVGSEVYASLKLGRRAIGIELKPSYYRQASYNIAEIFKPKPETQSLFEQTTDLEKEIVGAL
jgi:DNA modification methylase